MCDIAADGDPNHWTCQEVIECWFSALEARDEVHRRLLDLRYYETWNGWRMTFFCKLQALWDYEDWHTGGGQQLAISWYELPAEITHEQGLTLVKGLFRSVRKDLRRAMWRRFHAPRGTSQ